MSESCPICYQSLPTMELERHVNGHLDDAEIARDMELAHNIDMASSSELFDVSNGFDPGSWDEGCSSEHSEVHCDNRVLRLIAWQKTGSFYQVKEGMMELLKRCLGSDKKNIRSIISCSIDHYQSSAPEDLGWGCGWRNIQMLSSYLLFHRQDLRYVLYGGSGFVPDILSLQTWLEIAWEKGFDRFGAAHFDGKVHGSKKWIGTTECAALLRSFGLWARVVDFGPKEEVPQQTSRKIGKRKVRGPMDEFLSRTSSASELNFTEDKDVCKNIAGSPKNIADHHVLFDWVWSHFSGDVACSEGGVSVSNRTPLYFQHDGHSRTIVGIQIHKSSDVGLQQYSLLVLDPSQVQVSQIYFFSMTGDPSAMVEREVMVSVENVTFAFFLSMWPPLEKVIVSMQIVTWVRIPGPFIFLSSILNLS